MGECRDAEDALALVPDQLRLLRRLDRSQSWTAAGGVVLAALGLAYAVWGVARFDARSDPRSDPGFDRPVARLAFVYDSFQQGLASMEPQTPNEHRLRNTLLAGAKLSSGLLLLLLRLFLGTLTALAGLVMLTVVVERRRLLTIVRTLQTE